MKYLLILLFVLYSGCIKKKSYDQNYALLEYNWTTDILGEIVTGFKPNKIYTSWCFIRSDYTEKGKISVLFNSNFKIINLEDSFSTLKNGIIRKGHHSDKYYNIIVSKNDSTHILTNKEEVIDFLGEIDTKEEALFLAIIKGFNIDSNNAIASSYKKTAKGYNFLLMKSDIDSPLSIEYRQYEVNINRKGVVSWKKGEIYCSSYIDCYGTN